MKIKQKMGCPFHRTPITELYWRDIPINPKVTLKFIMKDITNPKMSKYIDDVGWYLVYTIKVLDNIPGTHITKGDIIQLHLPTNGFNSAVDRFPAKDYKRKLGTEEKWDQQLHLIRETKKRMRITFMKTYKNKEIEL